MPTLELKTRFHTSVAHLAAPDRGAPAEPQSLTQAVQATVERLNTSILRPVARSLSNLAFQPRFMLALLTYCYARQIYGSADVAGFLARDAALCKVCQNEFPGAGQIRQFRDDNRQAIRACLTAALSFLARQKMDAGIVTKVNEATLAEEASRRLTMATWMDTTEISHTLMPLTS
jgi:hypothetical protein